MTATNDTPKPAEQVTRASLNAAWQEIGLRFQEGQPQKGNANGRERFWKSVCEPHPNYTDAASYLQRAEEAYAKQNYGEALNYTAQGQDTAAKARLSEGWCTRFIALGVLALLTVYFAWALDTVIRFEYTCPLPDKCEATATPETVTRLGTQPAGMLSTTSPTLTSTLPVTMPIRLFWTDLVVVPAPCESPCKKEGDEKAPEHEMSLPILFWGFLGGVVWCMYGLGHWYSRRLFDKHYVYWYILNPWVAAVLGGVFVLTLRSGLVNADITTQQGNRAFLYLVSFVVGLATHDFLKLLIRIVTAVFTPVGSDRKSEEAAK